MGSFQTVSRIVPGFSGLLVGRYFANTLVETGKATGDDTINLVLDFEQVAAYSREVAADGLGVVFISRDSLAVRLQRYRFSVVSHKQTLGLFHKAKYRLLARSTQAYTKAAGAGAVRRIAPAAACRPTIHGGAAPTAAAEDAVRARRWPVWVDP